MELVALEISITYLITEAGLRMMIIGFEGACSLFSSEAAVWPAGLAVGIIGVDRPGMILIMIDRRRTLGLTHSTAEGACRSVGPSDSATPVEQPRPLQFCTLCSSCKSVEYLFVITYSPVMFMFPSAFS